MEEDLQHLFNISKVNGPMLIHAKFEKDPIRNSWVIQFEEGKIKTHKKNKKLATQ